MNAHITFTVSVRTVERLAQPVISMLPNGVLRVLIPGNAADE